MAVTELSPLVGLRRVRRPDDGPPVRDRALTLQHERDARAGRHERGQLAEERAAGVDGVEPLGLDPGQPDERHRADGEALGEDAVEDLAGVPGRDGVGLDDGERAFHEAGEWEGKTGQLTAGPASGTAKRR